MAEGTGAGNQAFDYIFSWRCTVITFLVQILRSGLETLVWSQHRLDWFWQVSPAWFGTEEAKSRARLCCRIMNGDRLCFSVWVGSWDPSSLILLPHFYHCSGPKPPTLWYMFVLYAHIIEVWWNVFQFCAKVLAVPSYFIGSDSNLHFHLLRITPEVSLFYFEGSINVSVFFYRRIKYMFTRHG